MNLKTSNSQSALWQDDGKSLAFAELCNALYEREILQLSRNNAMSLASIQGRIKSARNWFIVNIVFFLVTVFV